MPVRVFGKGKKERILPIGEHALAAIREYWAFLNETRPSGPTRCFWRKPQGAPLSARMLLKANA